MIKMIEKNALPLKSKITPGGCILTAGLGLSFAGSKCLGGGPEFGSKVTCCLPVLLISDTGFEGEWLPTLDPPCPESVVFRVMSSSLERSLSCSVADEISLFTA